MRNSILNYRAPGDRLGKSGGRATAILLALVGALSVSAVSGSILFQWQRSAGEHQTDVDWAAEQDAKAALKARGLLVVTNPLTRHVQSVSVMECRQLDDPTAEKLALLRHLIYVEFQGRTIGDA